MLVEDKYFAQDKNYLLKTVQAFSKDSLIDEWIEQILHAYNLQHNPMGLEDDFILELKSKIQAGKELLNEHYDTLAAIYRLNHGDNQLAFVWDGRTHMEVYDADWKSMYREWIEQLSMVKEVQRPIIRYSVSTGMVNSDFLRQTLRKGILSHFKLRMRSQTLYRVSA